MTTKRTYRKFTPQQKKIEELEETSPRFKRVFSEYEIMSQELWTLENTEIPNIPDDFIDAVKIQTEFLEDEIGDWLFEDLPKTS